MSGTWSDADAAAALEAMAALEASVRPYGAVGRAASGNSTWHIVNCVSRSDLAVMDWLQKLGVEFYYPRVREMRIQPRRELSKKQRQARVPVLKPVLMPMFPRYLFVRFDMGRDGWRSVFQFAGVRGMVCAGDLPVRVPEAVIERLRETEVDGAVPGKTPARLVFGLGDRVRIGGGAFAGFHGVVERGLDMPIEEIDPEVRITVAIDIFGRSTPVEVGVAQVDRV